MDARLLKGALSHMSVLFLSASLPGAWAIDETGPVIASAAVAFVMLLILISMIVFAVCYSESWVRSNMKQDGKVKMPKSYFRKKKEAKRRILEQRKARLVRTTYAIPKPALSNGIAGVPPVTVVDKDQMVQGWNQQTSPYEIKAFSIELGEENDETEFQIETTLVDNEVLDVGPFKNMEPGSARPVDGNVYNNPYIYSNNDRSSRSGSSRRDTKVAEGQGVVSVMAKGYDNPNVDMNIDDIIVANGSTVKGNSIDDQIIKL